MLPGPGASTAPEPPIPSYHRCSTHLHTLPCAPTQPHCSRAAAPAYPAPLTAQRRTQSPLKRPVCSARDRCVGSAHVRRARASTLVTWAPRAARASPGKLWHPSLRAGRAGAPVGDGWSLRRERFRIACAPQPNGSCGTGMLQDPAMQSSQ